jgi:tRNA-5-taurinomethyluridine 2-sulfurtransferase
MKIAVLLSGGVDSSVALKLLKDQGHDLTAFYLKIWLQDEFSFLGECPWEEDLKFVKAVCEQNNIPLEILSLQNEYWDSVVSYTIAEIKEGRTPNPDMFCNSLIKFGQFYEKINSSFEKVASGHYAKVVYDDNSKKFILRQSPDPIKDQSYFLAYLTQQQLSRAYFPIGRFNKKQIRIMAEDFSLPNKNRKDSQGICFLGKVKFHEFVKHHLGEISGDIVDVDKNKKVGRHDGYYFYTIGQRSGLKLPGGPWFVVGKDVQQNVIYISRENKLQREKKEYSVGKFNWISGSIPENEKLEVKIRHGEKKFECKMNFNDNDSALVKMQKADSGIAPGQFAVFYDNDICLGGGMIL